MDSLPGRHIRLANAAGDHISGGLDTMNRLSKLQKYHEDYVPQRRISKVVAVTPAALEIEKQAINRELKGQFRLAAHLWLQCMDVAKGEIERARIAVRRGQCIDRSKGLRSGDYAGICCRGVVYD